MAPSALAILPNVELRDLLASLPAHCWWYPVYHKCSGSSDMNSPRHSCGSGQTLSQTASVSVIMSCALALIWALEKLPKLSDPATTTIACSTWSCKQNISASSVATSDKYNLSLKKYFMPVKTASSGYLWRELKNLGIRYCT